MAIRAVFFDLGETLIDESRLWAEWAKLLDVPLFTLFGIIGGLAERGEHHQRVFEMLRPGFDLEAGEHALKVSGVPICLPSDFYPDALPCLSELRARGYHTGIAGNQPAAMENALAELNLPVDTIASSTRWGVAKPSPTFFKRIADECGLRQGEIAHVGDRIDNDILPAIEAGLKTVFVKRGPFGYLHASLPDAALADLQIDSLDGLADRLLEL